jgi:hypothetical protein
MQFSQCIESQQVTFGLPVWYIFCMEDYANNVSQHSTVKRSVVILFRWLQIYISVVELTLALSSSVSAADADRQKRLQELAAGLRLAGHMEKQQVQQWAFSRGIATRMIRSGGGIVEMVRYPQPPLFRTTHNLDAARTTRTTALWSQGDSGWNLSGQRFKSGMLALWDAGNVYIHHPEFVIDGHSRIRLCDSNEPVTLHASHVAGTMVAQGLHSQAKGMAFAASLDAYDWWDDYAEMAEAAADGLLLSNHSYGWITGWANNWWYDENGDGIAQADEYKWCWFGDPHVSLVEDYLCGFYNEDAAKVDEITYLAPYYLVVKSAGNERSSEHNQGPAVGEDFWQYDYDEASGEPYRRLCQTESERPADGNGNLGYDGLEGLSVAKNTLTVGAILDGPEGCVAPSDAVMTDFSSWGPTDDGRIKPDLAANGSGLFSCSDSSQSGYAICSGTSMAAPNVSGSLALLQELYQRTHLRFMRSATLKALAIHGANEAGAAPGPDYRFGWGVFNAERCARIIQQDENCPLTIQEITLLDGEPATCHLHATGNDPLKVTIVWTDPPGAVSAPALDSDDSKLVNDLDLRIRNNVTGNLFYPWTLDALHPDRPAQPGDNHADNVEQIAIANPGQHIYTVTIQPKNQLRTENQELAMIITGAVEVVLPVELAEVCAVQDPEGVTIRWSTASESENLGFKIYRSESTAGPFEPVNDQYIEGAGHSSSWHSYSYRDLEAKSEKNYYYKIADIDFQGHIRLHDTIQASRRTPDTFQLQQNYPNPFNSATQLFFALPKTGRVQIDIFSIDGRCVRKLLDEHREAGSHMIVWNGCDDQQQPLPSGLYICRVQAEGARLHRKMHMIK